MKHSAALVIFLATGILSMPATAACTDDGFTNRLNQAQIRTALNNKRILATGGGEEWNEDHCSNGNLFKVGVSPDDPVDPRAYRGTWSTFRCPCTYNNRPGRRSPGSA